LPSSALVLASLTALSSPLPMTPYDKSNINVLLLKGSHVDNTRVYYEKGESVCQSNNGGRNFDTSIENSGTL
jgi:hypothetical protein